jgi:DNA modification methylase
MNFIFEGDSLEQLKGLESGSVHCCVTSPPYWGLRDYGNDGQLGLEKTPDEYVANMTAVFREVRRLLRDDGTLWLNAGDSYSNDGCGPPGKSAVVGNTKSGSQSIGSVRQSGLPDKNLVGIPWRLAFALQADGWILRSDIIWHKPNPMPESVRDRCTKAHEYVFMFSKRGRYYWDQDAVSEPSTASTINRDKYSRTHKKADGIDREWQGSPVGIKDCSGGRNIRTVWTIATQPFSGAHFACMPPKLAENCIKAGCPEGGTVLDPFFGAGTTGLVANRLRREYIGIEINPEYAAMAARRIEDDCPMFNRPVKGEK